jgi:hypothetical protein
MFDVAGLSCTMVTFAGTHRSGEAASHRPGAARSLGRLGHLILMRSDSASPVQNLSPDGR